MSQDRSSTAADHEPIDSRRERVARRALALLPSAVLVLVLGFLVVLPIGMLVYTTFVDEPPRPGSGWGNFTTDNYSRLFDTANLVALRNSLLIGVGGTLLAMCIGCGLAWLAARTDVPGRRLVQVAGVVPLFISSLVGALAWSLIASPRAGYLNIVLRDLGIPVTISVYSIPGMIFVFGIYYAPYAFLFVHSALTLMNPELEEAGEAHGGERRLIVRRVTFPLMRPAILGASLITLVLIFENFPIPTTLGARERIEAVPSSMYRLMVAAPSKPNEAAAMGMMLMAIMVTLVYIQRRLLAGKDYATVTGKGFKPKRISLGKWRWPAAAAVAAYVTLAVILPLFALVQSALRPHQFIPNTAELFNVDSFSLRNVREVLKYEPLRMGLRNTIVLGVITATLGGALHFALAYISTRTRLPGRGLVEYLAMLPAGIPALVMGVGFLWSWTRLTFLPLYGTLVILALAYTARFMPQGFRSLSGTLAQVQPDLEESAYVAGASRLRAVIKITIPLIRTGVASTMLLLFILSMRELSTTIFLFTSDTRVLSVVIFEQWASGNWPRVATISLIQSALLLILTIISRRWFRSDAV